jgi:hypothetical protein
MADPAQDFKESKAILQWIERKTPDMSEEGLYCYQKAGFRYC